MPGKNDVVTVWDNIGIKSYKQKRIMLLSLKEAYQQFKTENSAIKIGFSKFAELRPKECVQPGSNGTHTVCVCTIHQNIKLLISGSQTVDITNGQIKNYKDCLAKILCEKPTSNCYDFTCDECPGVKSFIEYLQNCFILQNELGEIRFSQWTYTDRCDLEVFVKNLAEFLDYFSTKLIKLIPHHYVSEQQSKYIKELKENLLHGEVLVSCDFAENYSVVMQNEAQSFHWNSKQVCIQYTYV